jgi:carboxypeptidase C (cathepsin A)
VRSSVSSRQAYLLGWTLATPFYQGVYEMHHLPIPPNLQSNIEYCFYDSGHMVYAKDASLQRLQDNVADFVRRTARTQ